MSGKAALHYCKCSQCGNYRCCWWTASVFAEEINGERMGSSNNPNTWWCESCSQNDADDI